MLNFFRTPPPPPPPDEPTDLLDQVLLGFSEADPFTVRDACEGVQIFGGTGSGKTSGSGAMLAKSYLHAGFGGLVLTVKADETALWRQYVAQAGRENDLIVLGANSPHRFNVFEYEAGHAEQGAGLTENLVCLFDTLSQVASRGGHGSRENESYWLNEQRKLLRNTIDILRLAGFPVNFPNLYEVVISAPQSVKQLEDTSWQADSLCYDAILAATERSECSQLTPGQQSDFELCSNYWTKEFPNKDERPRSTVVSGFTGMADVFLRGLLRELYSSTTTFTPEDTLDGRIILIDLPVKIHHEAGVYAQVLFKYCWQRAIERRQVTATSRPVFLWADESQHFLNEQDVLFQTTARASRACTVLLTQNLPNYHYAIGSGSKAKALVDSLLGNLSTKIFHNNTCAVTNQYAAELFARDWQQASSGTFAQNDGRLSTSQTQADRLEFSVLPREFSALGKGGPQNNYEVEAIVHQGGKSFVCSSSNALRTVFFQSVAAPSP